MIGGEYVRDGRSPEELYGVTGPDLDDLLAELRSDGPGPDLAIGPVAATTVDGICAVTNLPQLKAQ